MAPLEIDEEFDEMFDACLDRMAEGRSIEECLVDYPEHRERLRALLEAADTALSSATFVTPGASAKARGRARLRQQLEAGLPVPSGKGRLWRRISVPDLVTVPLAAVLGFMLVVLAVGSIAAVATDDSVPGDSLYWVKRTRENVMLTFSRSDTGKAEAHAELAGVRAEEMRKLIEQGRIAAAEQHLDAVREHLRASAQYAGIVITLNRIEMPSTRISIERSTELGTLVVTLKKDGDLLRIKPVIGDGPGLEDRQQRIDRIRWEFELSYRVLVAALYPDSAADPLWHTESIGTQAFNR